MSRPNELPVHNEQAAIELIREAANVRGKSETVVRQTLIAGFADVFPARMRPWWVQRHIRGAEHYLTINDATQEKGYADSVVGLTAVEYEPDLTVLTRFQHGQHQVRQYCTGLLNSGADPSKIQGVLSDGVEWRAYQLGPVPSKDAGTYKVTDVTLHALGPTLVCQQADAKTAQKLVRFLTLHFGRAGTRPLTARSVVDYLGMDEGPSQAYLNSLDEVIRDALAQDPKAAELIDHIWGTFVSYLSVETSKHGLDTETYVQEIYIATLAKLLCANVLESRAITADETEIERILSGDFFEAKGLQQFIEHDYFGWLNRAPHVAKIVPIACEIQADLAAYDFQTPPSDDLFGQFLAALAHRSRRLLLGQEFTPKALADEMAGALFAGLGTDEPPRFVDMCCGSGSMLVAATEKARERLAERNIETGSQEYIDNLANTCTGFDIDPLAVVLAKVNWVQTNRDALGSLEGSRSIFVPVFHADSLFALAPVFSGPGSVADEGADYCLNIYGTEINLPYFLIQPGRQRIFDLMIDKAYGLSLALAEEEGAYPAAPAVVDQLLDAAESYTSESELSEEERRRAIEFLNALIFRLAELQRDGRNGVWAFIIRNAYRPGLVAGQFNGLISNPPWLALSKIRNNPFDRIVRDKAKLYGLKPEGSAFLHLEMATVFLAHAVEHYLADNAVIASVLPDTVRNGSQHQPFRLQTIRYEGRRSLFNLCLSEIWMVEKGLFKNRAVVLLGNKMAPQKATELPGRMVPKNGTKMTHYLITSGSKTVWSENEPDDGVTGGYQEGFVRQGADIMPRRLIFFDTTASGGERYTIRHIDRDSPNWFLWSDAKKHKDYEISTRTVAKHYTYPVYLSKHLAPFGLAKPSLAVLPIALDSDGWRLRTRQEIALDRQSKAHFDALLAKSDFESFDEFWAKLDWRGKLSEQVFEPGAWIMVYGAGGGIPAAAYLQAPESPILFDQTLYWAECDKDEAIYFCGLVNSKALLRRVEDFIPEGAFGKRHLHTLPAKGIPKYDPSDRNHQAVVQATTKVLAELAIERTQNTKVGTYFTTTLDMNTRRPRLRAVIAELESYSRYEAACSALYADLKTQ